MVTLTATASRGSFAYPNVLGNSELRVVRLTPYPTGRGPVFRDSRHFMPGLRRAQSSRYLHSVPPRRRHHHPFPFSAGCALFRGCSRTIIVCFGESFYLA